jgi:hypothetical protein
MPPGAPLHSTQHLQRHTLQRCSRFAQRGAAYLWRCVCCCSELIVHKGEIIKELTAALQSKDDAYVKLLCMHLTGLAPAVSQSARACCVRPGLDAVAVASVYSPAPRRHQLHRHRHERALRHIAQGG